MTQDELKVLELEALIEDLRLNHEYCPKEVILQAADELERLSQRTEQEPQIAFNAEVVGYIAPQRSESSGKPSAWVGLTNEELTDLFYNTNLGQQSAVSQAVALLKQKNT
jgi:hypothetical protein